MSRQDQNQRIEAVVTAIRTKSWSNIKKAVQTYGHCVNDTYYYHDQSFTQNKVLHEAINTLNPDIVDYFFQWYEDVPYECDGLIRTAILTGNILIIQTVLEHVTTVEAWEFVLTARETGDSDIIRLVEQWAGERHVGLADQYAYST